jgi:hypothetical protein
LEKVAIMVMPTPLHTLAPTTLLWMDALRSRLLGAGWRLQTVVDPAAFRRAPVPRAGVIGDPARGCCVDSVSIDGGDAALV